MARPPKFVPIEDHLKMCDMQEEGSGPRVIAREFNGTYHPSHVTRLLTKCPELMASRAGREAVTNALAPAQTISSPNLSTSTSTASSPGATTLRVGRVSSDRNKPNAQKPQVKRRVSSANSVGSPAFGGDDDGDDLENDEYDEIDFDSLNYGAMTPIPTQTTFNPELVNPLTVLPRMVANTFNSGIIQTLAQFSDNLSRRLFPNLYPDPSYDAEVQELRDLIDKRDQDMNQTTPHLEKAGASQQPQTCTGYCGVEPEAMGSSIVDESSQLKGTGINSNLTPDPNQLRQKGKIIEPESFIVTQSNGLESQSVKCNAGPQEETKDPSHPITLPSPAPTSNTIGDAPLSTLAVQPLNDIQTFTPALNVKDQSSEPVLPGVAESQIGKQPTVIETGKSEFNSVAPPVSDASVEPKATINQTVNNQTVNNQTVNNEIDTTSMKGKNDVSWWDIVLPLALGGAAVLGVTCLERSRQPQQSSTARTPETPENTGQIRANFTRVFGPVPEPPAPLYSIKPENDKIVF